MALVQERQVSNLIFFLRDRWQFVCQDAAASEKNIFLSQEYLSCAVLESFFWLDLGVQTTYFPKPEARRVTYEYFPQFLKAYEHIQEKLLIQKFAGCSFARKRIRARQGYPNDYRLAGLQKHARVE